jgi:hypothetical protein
LLATSGRDNSLAVLDLDVEVVRPVDLLQPRCPLPRLARFLLQERVAHLAPEAGTGGDEPLAILVEQLVVYPWLVVEALGVSPADELHQVLVAHLVLGQQDHVVVAFTVHLGAHAPVTGGDVDLAADDGLYAFGHARLVKLDGAVKNPVVCDGDCWHPEVCSRFGNVFGSRHAVKQGALSVDVEMRE